jgi:hypothetical protein
LLWIALVMAVATVVLGTPPVVDAVVAGRFWPSLRQAILDNRAGLTRWNASLKVMLEALLATAISSSIFAASAASSLKRRLTSYQETLKSRRQDEKSEADKEIDAIMTKLARIRVTRDLGALIFWGPTIVRLTNRLFDLTIPGVQQRWQRVAIASLFTNFPGGLYGIFAYCSFLALTCVKVLQIYLAALPKG